MIFFDAACGLVSIGFKVIPLQPGKKVPLVKSWQEKATDDPDVISVWSEKYPMANIGIACGDVSGVVVIDVDMKGESNGMATLDRLAKVGKKLPPCPTAITPTGGRHLFFKTQKGFRNCAGLTKGGRGIGHGIDVRGNGGYVVAAPSVLEACDSHSAGKYRWLVPPVTDEFTPLPPWAATMIKPPKKTVPKFERKDDLEKSGDRLERIAIFVSKAQEGQRNNSLYWAARECLKHGIAKGLVYQRLTEAALAAKLPRDEIAATLVSGFRSEGEK